MKPSARESTKNTQEHLLKEPQAGSSRRLLNPWHRSTLSPQVEPPHTLSIPIRAGIFQGWDIQHLYSRQHT